MDNDNDNDDDNNDDNDRWMITAAHCTDEFEGSDSAVRRPVPDCPDYIDIL